MDPKQSLLASKGFLKRSLRPDDFEKFVLPALMSFLLIFGVYSTFDLQSSYGENSLDITLESLTEKQVLQVQDRKFPETMERPLETALSEKDKELRSKINSMRSKPLFMPKGLLSRMIFESGAFPFVPERMLAPWNPEQSYVEAVGLLRFRTDRISELEDRGDNYSYSEFQMDVEVIRSAGFENENVQDFLENSSSGSGATLSFMEDVSLEQVMSDGVDSVGLIDFLPSFLATFLIYYFVGAFSVQGNKELVDKIFGENEDVREMPNQ
jgi:hypothetical protein